MNLKAEACWGALLPHASLPIWTPGPTQFTYIAPSQLPEMREEDHFTGRSHDKEVPGCLTGTGPTEPQAGPSVAKTHHPIF